MNFFFDCLKLIGLIGLSIFISIFLYGCAEPAVEKPFTPSEETPFIQSQKTTVSDDVTYIGTYTLVNPKVGYSHRSIDVYVYEVIINGEVCMVHWNGCHGDSTAFGIMHESKSVPLSNKFIMKKKGE